MTVPAEGPSPSVRRRDRIATLTALGGVVLLAWLYLIRDAAAMNAAPMDMMGMRTWGPVDFTLTFLMWAIMMVGMMVPSAIPMTLLYQAVVQKARNQDAVVAPTMVFVGGYLAVWTAFSLAATVSQWGLESAALLSPMMVITSPAIAAGLLILAGVYQLTPLKEACLSHCRSPAHFISEHWRPGPSGAFRMGVRHGWYCLGCCWVLMLLLFVVGVMNLLWVAIIAIFVLIEKVVPHPTLPARIGGVALIGVGAVVLSRWFAQ